jgi:hypothetical protein
MIRIQDLGTHSFSSVLGVDPATLTGTLPAGAQLPVIPSRTTAGIRSGLGRPG